MVDKVIVIYPGRFQPAGKHHAAVFSWIQDNFDEDNSFIATSNVTDKEKSPFNFNEKKVIWSAYGFDDRIVQVRNPYKAEEITKKYNKDTTAVIFIVGEKDANRLSNSKYFNKIPTTQAYNIDKLKKTLKPLSEEGYVIAAPHIKLKVPGYGEMSGTSIRSALGDKSKSTEERKKLFKGIFGFESDPIFKFVSNKLIGIMEEKTKLLFSKNWWDHILMEDLNSQADTKYDKICVPIKIGDKIFMGRFKNKKAVVKSISKNAKGDIKINKKSALRFRPRIEKPITEGGSGGHMAHPFDLPQVKKGTDLVKVFTTIVDSIKKVPGQLKLDGVNTSIKLIDKNGKKQFALDRGTKKEADVNGVTVNKLNTRFPEGHGFLKIGKEVLTAFNASIPKITSQLKELGLWDDPNKLLNIETVFINDVGKANVIEYENDFFAILGVLQSEMKDNKRKIYEIKVNANTIDQLAVNASPIMEKLGYDIYGLKKLRSNVTDPISFTQVLNTSLPINIDGKKIIRKSLKDWLKGAVNPVNDKIVFADGKKNPVMSKKNYLTVLNQGKLTTLSKNPEDQQKIIDGAVFYHATRLMGTEILKKLGSELGDVSKHEGIVIRDPKIYKGPLKITGDFIVTGMQSGFAK